MAPACGAGALQAGCATLVGAALTALFPLPATPSDGAATAAPRKPSFVVVLADDLGYGDLGIAGSPDASTPHLDALARGGLRFTDFHANAPSCSPTRAALLTGRYPQRMGIVEALLLWRDAKGLPLEEITLAEVLREAGYATGLVGKWHLGHVSAEHPLRQGFDSFRGFVSGGVDQHSHVDVQGRPDWWKDEDLLDEEGYATDLLTAHAVRFIEAHRDEPFFLFVAYGAVHEPYQSRSGATARRGTSMRALKRQAAVYRDMLTALDDGVGQIVAALETTGAASRTLVFFTSDNGGTRVANHGPFSGRKRSLREGGHRVPAIARWPGRIEAGRVTDALTATMDLFPTLTKLAGAPLPADRAIDGADLTPLLLRGSPPAPRALFWETRKGWAMRDGDWKLIVEGRSERLHALSSDPGERQNLAGSQPERVRAMRSAHEAWKADVQRAPRADAEGADPVLGFGAPEGPR